MKASTDPAARAAGDLLLPINEERLQRLNLHGQKKKEQSYKKMEDELKKMNNGRAIVTAMNSRHRRNWIWTQRGLKPGNKIRLIQALSGTLPTMINKTRGIPDRRKKICTRCRKGEIEDDEHILSRCTFNKDIS